MCGLCGVAGDVTGKEEKIIKTLLMWGGIRGQDSTGLASIDRSMPDHKILVAKELGPYYFLEDTKRYNELFHGIKYCYIGHNRSKTIGEASRKNAHPFNIENTVIGAHNGTIGHQSKNRLEGGSEFKTDSEAIFNNIFVHGAEDTIKRLEKSDAYALTWYDSRDRTINLLRNEHRPLIWTTFNDGKTLMWASEFGMLSAAMGREGDIKVTQLKYYALTPDRWYSWKIPQNANEKMPEPVIRKMENYTYKYSGGYWEGAKFFPNGKGDEKKTTQSQTTSTTTPAQAGSSYETDSAWGDDDEDMEWMGPMIGYRKRVPKSDSGVPLVPRNVEVVDKAVDKLKSTFQATTSTGARQAAMTAMEVARKRAWDFAEKGGLVPTLEEKDKIKFHEDPNLKVWRNSSDGRWTYLQYDPVRNQWNRYLNVEMPPFRMPYQKLKDNDHIFKHMGKGTRKRVYYKGFQGAQIEETEFTELMQEGCAVCQRKPEWMNKVFFFSKIGEFICEWCNLTPGRYESLRKASENVNGDKKIIVPTEAETNKIVAEHATEQQAA